MFPKPRRCDVFALFCLTALAAVFPVSADVDLYFQVTAQDWQIGSTVDIAVYAASDSGEPESIGAADVVFKWDPTALQLLGRQDPASGMWLASNFPVQAPGSINEVLPPQDGDGLWTGWASLGDPVMVQPVGTHLTTLQFEALQETGSTSVELLSFWPDDPNDPNYDPVDPPAVTAMWSGQIPELNLVDELGAPVELSIYCWECPGDLDGSGTVDLADLQLLLAEYGSSVDVPDVADLNCDGIVNLTDLQYLLSRYGQSCSL